MIFKRILSTLALVCGSFLFLQGCGEDDPATAPVTGTIKGRISDAATGQAVEGASITTIPPSQSVISDNMGAYMIPDVSSGAYVVSVSKVGYNTRTVNVTVNANKSTTADVQLTMGPVNQPPAIPGTPTPADGAKNQPTSVTLRWASSDPDGDEVKYDIYFGTENPPKTIVAGDLNTFNHVRNDLQPSTVYYWQVLAKDAKNEMTLGPVWSFTTRSTQQQQAELVAFYPFNGDAKDASGNEHHGIVKSGVSPVSDRHGESSSAYYFNGGSEGYVEVPHTDDLNFGGDDDFSIALWIKFAGTPAQYTGVIAKGPTIGANVGYQVSIVEGTTTGFDVTLTKGYSQVLQGGKNINDNKWHFVVVTASSAAGLVRMYIDGILSNSAQFEALNCAMSNGYPLYIGKERRSQLMLQGSIDDVRIYRGLLSDAEIQSLAAL